MSIILTACIRTSKRSKAQNKQYSVYTITDARTLITSMFSQQLTPC